MMSCPILGSVDRKGGIKWAVSFKGMFRMFSSYAFTGLFFHRLCLQISKLPLKRYTGK
jgi:hypothetical protein